VFMCGLFYECHNPIINTKLECINVGYEKFKSSWVLEACDWLITKSQYATVGGWSTLASNR